MARPIVTATGVGVVLLALGFYLFPFGYDVVMSQMLSLTNGNYWMADLYMYFATGTMIVVGLYLTKPEMFKNKYFLVLLVGLVIAGFIAFSELEGA